MAPGVFPSIYFRASIQKQQHRDKLSHKHRYKTHANISHACSLSSQIVFREKIHQGAIARGIPNLQLPIRPHNPTERHNVPEVIACGGVWGIHYKIPGFALKDTKDKMDTFEYNPNPGRVVFGSGTLQKLPDEIARLQVKAPLVLSTPQQVSQAENVKGVLKGQIAGIFSEATMHTPTHVTDKALEYAKAKGADSVISIGGGSTIGLGKAISIRTGLPHICIPTTYAGSEMTPILGETADGLKKTRSDPKILPGTVIYDVDLTMTLPAAMSATSGVNAIAHAGKSARLSFINFL